LIIDQFEEIVTHHSVHWSQREDFFRQLDQAMADDPLLWVVLTFREDYLAALELTPRLAGNMRARFYMQRMNNEAALEAVKKPAAQGGRPFAPGVAEAWWITCARFAFRVNLLLPTVSGLQGGFALGGRRSGISQFVEPVQLQLSATNCGRI